ARIAQIHGGRLTGYALAGAAAGGIGHGVVTLAGSHWLSMTLRALVGLSLMLIALRLSGHPLKLLSRVSARKFKVPSLLAPLYRFVLPANTGVRRVAAGALW